MSRVLVNSGSRPVPNRVQCVCTNYRCSSQPEGFRLVTDRVRREHRTRTEPECIPQSSKAILAHGILSNILKDLAFYTAAEFPTRQAVPILHKALDPRTSSLRQILSWADPANSSWVAYTEWHEKSVDTIQDLRGLGADFDELAKMTINVVLGLYERALAQLLGIFHQHQFSHSHSPNYELTRFSSVVEAEISFAVRRYGYDSPLSFHPNGVEVSSIANFFALDTSSMGGSNTFKQLLWIEAALLALGSGRYPTLTSLRSEELTSGLHEHRNNVVNHIRGERLRQRSRTKVQTIMQSE